MTPTDGSSSRKDQAMPGTRKRFEAPQQVDDLPGTYKGVLSDTPIVGLDGEHYPDPICDNDDLWSSHMVIVDEAD